MQPFKNVVEKFQVPIVNSVVALTEVSIKLTHDISILHVFFLFVFIPHVKKAKMPLATVI